ncbi:hypothetical protein UK14_14115, partial [Streptomyces sp. NRRL F-4428]
CGLRAAGCGLRAAGCGTTRSPQPWPSRRTPWPDTSRGSSPSSACATAPPAIVHAFDCGLVAWTGPAHPRGGPGAAGRRWPGGRPAAADLIDIVSALDHPDTHRETLAERMLLPVPQGHCNSPIAGYARAERSGDLSLRASVFTPAGKVVP